MTLALTYFGSRRNHHQGTVLCLAKTTNMVFFCARWTARLHNRLIYRHNIDWVYTDEHTKKIVVLAKHRTVPWWWCLREPKHVGASVIILNCFNICDLIIVCISWNNKKCFWYYWCTVQIWRWCDSTCIQYEVSYQSIEQVWKKKHECHVLCALVLWTRGTIMQ